MKIAALIVRILLGLMFLFFGAMTFVPMKEQPVMPEEAAHFNQALMSSGYMKAVGVFELAGGLLLLTGRFAPLGLVLLAPVMVNILFFHAFLSPALWQPGVVVSAMEIFLIYYYRSAFAGLWRPHYPGAQG